MYAEHRYMPRQSRGVSFGAAFAINGAIVAGMLFYLAPDVIPMGPTKPITIIDILDPPIPPETPRELPNTKRARRAPLPTIPKPLLPTESEFKLAGTETIYPPQPPQPPLPTGEPTLADPPVPLPPLMVAEQDPRFARDFQPAYPASELRAQRDGAVRIRVLIGVDGRVKAAEPVSATSDAFFEATRRQALSKWRFKPATRGGVPQESWKTMSVRFEIKSQ